VNSLVAYPNRARLTGHTAVADVNVVIARGQVNTSLLSNGNVANAGGIVLERKGTDRIVSAPEIVKDHRVSSNRYVL
jgi:hypothetical protein